MRIGLFSDYFMAKGDGTAIATHITRDGLEAGGHRVFVFCPITPGYMEDLRDVIAFRSIPGFFYQGLRFTWPLSNSHKKIAENLNLDIIHVQTPLPVGLLGLWCGKRLNIPTVFTAHLDMDFMDQYYISTLAMMVLGFCTAIITHRYREFAWRLLSPKVRKDAGKRQDFAWRMMAFFASQFDQILAPSAKSLELLSQYLPDKKISLVPNGVNLPTLPAKPAARKQLKLGEDFLVISTARHVKEKRIEVIIRGFATFCKSKETKLLVLNNGPLSSYLRSLTKELAIEDKVVFCGTVAHDAIFSYLAASDIFVNASLREIASLGVLEAAASGRPLLLADKRLAEPLENGSNGYFFTTSTQLATQLAKLYDDKRLRERFGKASKARVVSKYSQKAHAKSLLAAYKKFA